VWYLAPVIQNFKIDKIQAKVLLKMQKRLEEKQINKKKLFETTISSNMSSSITNVISKIDVEYQIFDFTESLTEVFK